MIRGVPNELFQHLGLEITFDEIGVNLGEISDVGGRGDQGKQYSYDISVLDGLNRITM